MRKYFGFLLLMLVLSSGVVTCQSIKTPTPTVMVIPTSSLPTAILPPTVSVVAFPTELPTTELRALENLTPTLTSTVFIPSPPVFFTSLLTSSKDLQILPGRIPSLPLAGRDYPDLASWVQANIDSATLWVNYVGGNEALYHAEMAHWDTSSSTRTLPANVWIEIHDLDNDGEDELILSFPIFSHYLRDNDPRPFSFFCDQESGMCFAFVFIFKQQAGVYNPVCWIGDVIDYDETPNNTPRIFALEDINHDGLAEVMLSEYLCGATTCFTTMHIVNWNGHECRKLGTFGGQMAEISLVDDNNDGLKEVHVHFTQKGITDIYVLGESQYEFSQSISDK